MKNLLIVLGGVAVGVLSTAIYVKKKLVPDLVEEIERKNGEAASDYAEYWTDGDETETDDYKEDGVLEAPVKVKKTGKPVATDYTQFSKESEKKDDGKKVVEPNNSAPEETHIGGTDPYLIDASEFDMFSDYQAHQFVMYADGVVIDDETDEELDADPELVFGTTAMDALKKEEVVFVRDDSKKQDYCIERRDIPFDGPDYPDPEDDWRS